MREKLSLFGFLAVLGAAWGVTQPLVKIATLDGYRQFGMIFWQSAIAAAILGLICAVRGRGLPLGPVHLGFYLFIALVGTVLPHAASYQAVLFLPVGVLAITLSLIPMIAFPVALLLGNESFRLRRLLGLTLGLVAMLMIALPQTSLPDPSALLYLPLALIPPLFYAVEGNVVARWGTHGLDPFQVMFGASLVSCILSLPMAVMLGQFIAPHLDWELSDWALAGSSIIHALTYTGYVWLVGRAGAVFAVQVSYPVTAFGLVWAMVLLDETYSVWVWGAFAVMLAGLVLVQPRPRFDSAMKTERLPE